MKNNKNNPFGNLPDSGYEFDMSISTLMRINYYLYIANGLSGSEDVQGLKDWFDAVRVVDREIDPLLKDKEAIKVKVLRGAVERVLNIRSGGNHLSRNILYGKIDEYERMVRRLVHDKKIYMKQSEDAGKALLR
jgi:hypothetical protein